MSLATIILAAGQGTRMRSDKAKVLHELLGEPMISHPIRLALGLGAKPIVLVVGHQAKAVEGAVAARFGDQVRFALQAEQKGTGHAVMQGMTQLAGAQSPVQRVLILYGDVPLLRPATVAAMMEQIEKAGLPLVLVTTTLANPKGYGRIVRDADGKLLRIVEEKDASDEFRRISEINAGIYVVARDFLESALGRLKNDNAQKEYYLTDIVALAKQDGHQVGTVHADDASEVKGANTRGELAELGAALRKRVAAEHMANGVSLVDPERSYIGLDVQIGADTVIEPNVHLRGKTRIGKGCSVDTGVVISDGVIADGVTIKPYTVIEDARVETGAILGPFARLRPGAEVMEEAHVGNFVELKKARLGKGAKANHLAYLGDAIIGDKANIGAGTITCNYDGYGKYLTEIGNNVFVGSNSTLVAPLKIGENAYVAAGSVLTDPVADNDLAFGRSRQVNKTGRAKALREEAEQQARAAKQKKG